MEAKMENFVLQLPVEITTDIFSRLPVGSVIRCKVVCKAWRSLVEDPVFLDIHTSRLLLKPADDADAAAAAVTTNTEFYLTVQQLQKIRPKHHFGECNNHEVSSSSSRCCFKLSKPLNAKDDDDPFSNKYYWQPIGSSNGLICSYGIDEVTIYVYNPCTRESVRLPPPMPITKPMTKLSQSFSGFGYNSLTNEYKVVVLIPSNPGAEVCVYTLGSGKWRTTKQLESWRLNVQTFKPGVFFNGALHWIAWKLINIDHYDIFSFDLTNEEFRIIIPSPPLSSRVLNNRFYVQLGLLGGCCRLCVRHWNRDTETIDIWVLMNNSKDIKSWTIKFNIPSGALNMKNKFRLYYPIVLLGSEKILLYTYEGKESFFVTYDSETGSFEDQVVYYSELQPSELKWGYYFSVIPYTKSFVSLKPFGEEDAGLSF